MRQTKVVSMTEGGVLAAVAIVFAMISAYIPIIGSFVNLIWPVPIILLGVRHGYKWSIMATVVAGIIITIILHPLHAVTVVVGFGLIGIVLGYCFRSSFSPFKAMLWGSVASLVSKIAVLSIGALILGINPITSQVDAMGAAVSQAAELYRSFGMKEEDLAKIAENMQTMITYMKVVFPAGLVLASIVDTYLNFVVAKAVLKKLGHQIEAFPPFKEWSMPIYLAWGFVVAVLMIYWGQSREITLLYDIGMNLQVIISIFLFIQGLSLIYFLTDKYNLSKFTRGIILFMVLTSGLFLQGLLLAGAFDIAFDYRRLRGPRQS